MFTTLNIVIGLIFVLLLFSLLTSTVMEVIASMLSLKAKHLRLTLENMLGDKVDDFTRHPFFIQLTQATNRRKRISHYALPTYISKDTFSTILQDILLNAESKEALSRQIESMDDTELKRMLQFILRQGGDDPAVFQAQIEHWYDEVMERASDWYKRTMKWWLFGTGLTLAVIFNADTIKIYQNISSSATVQDFLVDMASNYAAKTDSVTNPNLKLPVETSIARLDSALQQIEHIRSPLGIGWDAAETNQSVPGWLVKLAGLLLTGIAVTFGAPFWFDLLKKVMNLRGGLKESAPAPAPPPAAPAEKKPVRFRQEEDDDSETDSPPVKHSPDQSKPPENGPVG